MPCLAACLVMDSMSSPFRASKTYVVALLVLWLYSFGDFSYSLGCPGARFHTSVLMVSIPSVVIADSVRWSPSNLLCRS
jgi:hypothetical protein